MATISFNPRDVKPLLSSLGLDQAPDTTKPDVSQLPPPPMPPPRTPAQAGFDAWNGDPQNQAKVLKAITTPGQPIVPAPPPPVSGSLYAGATPPPLSSAKPLPGGNLSAYSPAAGPSTPPLLPYSPHSQVKPLAGMQGGVPDVSAGMRSANVTPSVQALSGMSGSLPNVAAPSPSVSPAIQPLPGFAGAVPNVAAPLANVRPLDPAVERLQTDQAELTRLQKTGSGASQIKNPWLRTIARIGDAAGTVLAPGVMAVTPGSTVHNWTLQNLQQGKVAADQSALKDQADLAKSAADTAYETARPGIEQNKLNQKQLAAQQRISQHAAGNGQNVTYNDDGMPTFTDDPTSQAFKDRQSLAAMHQATADSDAIKSEIQRNRWQPGTPEYADAQRRLQQVDRRLQVATAGLGLRRDNFNMKAYNVGPDGKVLPGSLVGEDGVAIGTANAANVRPTGQERNKGDMANSAQEQLGTLKSIVQKRPDIFGPASGRKTDFNVWMGSQDPDAQRFRAARTIAGDHLAGTFGGRSESALTAIDNAIGQFKDNPAAVAAGLDQLSGANTVFQKAGRMPVAGSGNAPGMQTSRPGGKHGPGSPPLASYKQTATGAGGHKIGTNDGNSWFDVQTGKRVQ